MLQGASKTKSGKDGAHRHGDGAGEGKRAQAAATTSLSVATYLPAGQGGEGNAAVGPMGEGNPLEGAVRDRMERGFGVGFGGVRIHTGARADTSARAVDALAYTVGRDVVFRDGYFSPGTPAGQKLLAHELAHVVQQEGGNGVRLAAAADAPLPVGRADDPAEREADAAAGVVTAGGVAAGLVEGGAPRIRRQEAPGPTPQADRVPEPIRVTWGGDEFEVGFERIVEEGVDHLEVRVRYAGPHPTDGPFVRDATKRLRARLPPRRLDVARREGVEQEIVLDLYGDRTSVVRLVDDIEFDDRTSSRGRRHGLSLRLNGRTVGTGGVWVLDPAASAADARPFAPGFFPGTVPEFQGFSLTDGPPRLELRAVIDGDGDRYPELEVFIQASSFMSWASEMEETETVRVRLRQANDPLGAYRTADFQLTRPTPGSALAPRVAEATDGRAPTVLEMTRPASDRRLRIFPPVRTPGGVRYRVEGLGQVMAYDFPPEPGEVRPAFEVENSGQGGRIAFWDIQLGPYSDAFRILLDRGSSADRAVLGIAPLSGGRPYGGVGVPVNFSGSLAQLALLRDDPVSLGLDFDGDGTADLRIHDRLQVPTGAGDVSPESDRDHHVRISGPAVGTDRVVTITVRDGFMLGGHSGTGDADRSTHAAARAVGELHAQAGTDFESRRADFHLAFHGFRRRAVDSGWITQRTYDAWYALSSDMIRLEVQAASGSVEPGLRGSAAANARELYEALSAETAAAWQRVHTGATFSYSESNPYTGATRKTPTLGSFPPIVAEGPGAEIQADLGAGRWSAALDKFRAVGAGLDRWLIESASRHGVPAAEQAQMRWASSMRRELDALAGRSPVRIPAVFRPDRKFASEPGFVEQVSLELYYWRDGNTWRLVDLTNPERPFHDSVTAGGSDLDTAGRLLGELDDKDHFCEGRVYYDVPGIATGQVAIRDRVTWRDFFSWLGLGLAAVGLTLVTFGTGTVAVVGTWALVASGAAGATAATINLVESRRHGTATTASTILDVAQIVGAIAGVGALAAGRVLSVARTAAAAGTPLAGARWAALASLSQRYVVPLAATNLGADVVTLAVLSVQGAEQLDAIENGPGSAEAKRAAKARLLAQLAFTGGLTALSLRGNVAEITMGRSIEVVNVGGHPVVVPVGTSMAGRSITESGARISGTADMAGEQAHLANIRSRMEGTAGVALANVESLALAARAGRAEATLVADAAGAVAGGRPGMSTLQEVVDSVARANNASRAHGVDLEYVLELRPGAAPGTTEARVTSRARTPAAPDSTGHLYVNVAERTAAEAAQLQRLRTAAGGTPFRLEMLPDGRVAVNGQIDVHPARLAEMSDVDLATFVRATHALETAGSMTALRASDPATASQIDRFASSTPDVNPARAPTRGFRFRFHHSRATAQAHLDALLAQVGTTRAAQPGLRNLSESDLNRLYDIFNASVPGGTTALPRLPGDVRAITRLEAQATRYAVDQAPGDARTFVEHYEFYMADYTARVNAEIQSRLAGGTVRVGDAAKRGIRRDVETAMGDPSNPHLPGVSADVRGVYDRMSADLGDRVGSVVVPTGLDDAATVTAIQRLDRVNFGSPSAAVYHARKHYVELPAAEKARDPSEIRAYVDSAAETVRTADPAAVALTRNTSQDGRIRSYSFVRTVEGTTLRAIVMVFSDGRVMIATYP